jgi:hypothetical protein
MYYCDTASVVFVWLQWREFQFSLGARIFLIVHAFAKPV